MAGDFTEFRAEAGNAMIPVLPAEAIRAAVRETQWSHAEALLAAHDRELHAALAALDPATIELAPWQALLDQQDALLEELRQARDEAAAALAQLGRERRGLRAYQQQV